MSRRNRRTFALAGRRPQVPRRDEAEARRAVGGHGVFIQGDDLVAEVQRAVEPRAQLLHHPHQTHAGHLLDHSRGGVELTEDHLREGKTQRKS